MSIGSRVCPTCAAPASSWARFCRECGTDLPVEPTLGSEQPGEAQPIPEVPWRARDGALIWLLAFALTILPAAFVLGGGLDCGADRLTPSDRRACDTLLGVTLAVNQLGLLGLTVLWVKGRHKAPLAAVGLTKPTLRHLGVGAATALLGVLLAYAVSQVAVLIYDALTTSPVKLPKQIDLKADPTTTLLVFLGVTVIVLAPIAEEVFFRGFLYRGIRRWARPNLAIAISAIVFGAAHLLPLVVLATAVLGALFASVAEREGSITPTIIAHMLFNIVGFAVAILTQGF